MGLIPDEIPKTDQWIANEYFETRADKVIFKLTDTPSSKISAQEKAINQAFDHLYKKIDYLQQQITSLQNRKEARDYYKMTAAERRKKDADYLTTTLLTDPETKTPLYIARSPRDNKDGSYTLFLCTETKSLEEKSRIWTHTIKTEEYINEKA